MNSGWRCPAAQVFAALAAYLIEGDVLSLLASFGGLFILAGALEGGLSLVQLTGSWGGVQIERSARDCRRDARR